LGSGGERCDGEHGLLRLIRPVPLLASEAIRPATL
jgi:hypothetical protein